MDGILSALSEGINRTAYDNRGSQVAKLVSSSGGLGTFTSTRGRTIRGVRLADGAPSKGWMTLEMSGGAWMATGESGQQADDGT